MNTLEVNSRDAKKDLQALRGNGIMPAVFYGRKQASTSISLPLKDFIKVWKEAGESGVVTLNLEKNQYDALIHSVDINPVTDVPRHADFYVFEKGQKMEIDVPLEFIGVSPAVKELGGVLLKVLHELKVEAEPKNLPHEINIDISSLVDFEARIFAKNIILPEGVTLLEKPEEIIALVNEAVEEKEEVAPVDISAIEVEKKGKEKDGAAEGSEEGEEKTEEKK